MTLTDVSHSRNLFKMRLFEVRIRTERVQMLHHRPAVKMFAASCFPLDQHQMPSKTAHEIQENLGQAAALGPAVLLPAGGGGVTQQEPLSRVPQAALRPL